jgi:large subunit ribosomal protein L21e
MPKTSGIRNRSRHKLRKKPRGKGMQSLGRLIYDYEIGEKVVVFIDPSVQKGMPHPRYHGYVASVLEKRGKSYVVGLKDGKIDKKLTVRPEHIKPHNK